MFPWRSFITIVAFAFLFAFVSSEFRREQQSHLSKRTQRAAEQRELTKSFAARSPARKIGLEYARDLTKRDVCTDAYGDRVTQTCQPSETLCCKLTWDVISSIKFLTFFRHYSSRRPTTMYDNPRIWLLLHRVCSFSTMRLHLVPSQDDSLTSHQTHGLFRRSRHSLRHQRCEHLRRRTLLSIPNDLHLGL
jgi:hypothetical protein